MHIYEMFVYILISIFISMYISKYLVKKYENYILEKKDITLILLLSGIFTFILYCRTVNNMDYFVENIWIKMIINILFSIIGGVLSSSFVIDMRYRELPDENSIIAGISVFLISLIMGRYSVVLSSVIMFVVFFVISVVTNQFGMGDVKMMSLMALGFLPNKILSFLYTSFFIASVYSIGKLVLKKAGDKKISFGPFLIIGFLLIL